MDDNEGRWQYNIMVGATRTRLYLLSREGLRFPLQPDVPFTVPSYPPQVSLLGISIVFKEARGGAKLTSMILLSVEFL